MHQNKLKDHRQEHVIVTRRLWLALYVMLLLWAVLVARLFYLQVSLHDNLATLSEDNRIHIQPLAPPRGLVYDGKGQLLAENIPSHTLMVVRERISGKLKDKLAEIKKLISLSESELDKFYDRLEERRPFEPTPLKFRLTEREIALISVNIPQLLGFEIEAQLVRHYPKKELFAHAVGYVGRINSREQQVLDRSLYSGTHIIGKTGVERYYETALLGKPGYQEVETNASGRVLRVLKRANPTQGQHLHLYLDSDLQQVAMKALNGKRGAVVAMEPSTGGILALVSTPSFDPNLFVTGIDIKAYGRLRENVQRPLYNRAALGEYPPASTIKPFVALAALLNKSVRSEFTVNDPGFFQLESNEHKYRNWLRKGHGKVNMHRALVVSNDTYFYTISVKMGIDIMHEYLTQFGFGTRTGLDIAAERPGLIPSREWKQRTRRRSWYTGETVITGIGQGYMLTTPLQLATATALIANRGNYVVPRLLKSRTYPQVDKKQKKKEIQKNDANQVLIEEKKNTEAVPDVIKKAAKEWVFIVQAMADSVRLPSGTAHRRMSPDLMYSVAGKTGTAQVVGIAQDKKYNASLLEEFQRDHGLFIGFAPVENPKIAIAVIVENDSKAAVPIARKVMDQWLLKK